MLRSLRRPLGLTLLALALASPAPAQQPPAVSSTAVPLDPADPGRNALGKAVFRGGVALASEDPFFGGWSDLLVSPDGGTLVAVGDQGGWMTAALQYDGEGNLAAVVVTATGQLKDLAGAELGPDKSLADAEALAPGPDGGYLVGFERQHRLWLYSPDLAGTPVQAATPPAVLDLDPAYANEGIEGMARLPDGRLILFLEGGQDKPGTLAYLQEDEGFAELPYARQDGFQVTGVAPLPDGGLLIVERFYSPETGPKARLRRLPAESVGKAVSAGSLDLLLELAQPLSVDNIEGVAAWQEPDGGTRVLLLSDDNFNRGRQRTLLLDFELVE